MLDIMDFFFGPNRSSDRAAPSGSGVVYETVNGRLYARVGKANERVAKETADELEWLRHSVMILRDAILAHKKARDLRHDAKDVTLLRYAEEDVELWSHVSE